MKRACRAGTLVLFAALGVGACGGGDSGDPSGPIGAFSLAVSPGQLTLDQGGQTSLTVTVTRSGGFAGAVQVTLEGLPQGVTAGALTIAGAGTSGAAVLSATAGATVGGPVQVTVRATGAGLDPRTATFQLTVNEVTVPTPAFALAVSPAAVQVVQGASGEATVTITRSGGFAGAVTLSASGLPSGVTASFTPPAPSGTTSTLAFQVGGGAPTGNHTVTVQGTGNGVAAQSAQLTLQITEAAPPPGGNVTFQFCGIAGGVPLWAAFQDGDGPWTRVLVVNAQAQFQVTEDRGGVAWVVPMDGGGFGLEVLHAAREELIEAGVDRCNDRPGTGKTVTAAVQGVSSDNPFQPQFAFASLGGLIPFEPGPQLIGLGQITFEGVPDGPVDLIAGRTTLNAIAQTGVPDRMVLRRGLNPAAGSALAAIDFGGGDSFAPQASPLTITGVGGGELVVQTVLLRTANGFGPLAVALGQTANWWGIPQAQVQSGDLHILGVSAGSTAPLAPSRTTLRMVRDPGPVTVGLGPQLSEPVLQPIQAGNHPRVRAEYTIQPEYDRYWVVDVQQGGQNPRDAQIQVTRAYHGSGAGTVVLEIPDFSGVDGWNPSWGLTTAVQATWTLSAAGWAQSGGIFIPPFQDGAEYRTASRMGALFLP